MDRWNELDFAQQVPLRNKVRHAKGFNYSCPFCSDKKRRAYLLLSNEGAVAYCHNCGSSLSLKKLIEAIDPTLYESYLICERGELKNRFYQDGIGKKKEAYTTLINSITDKEHDLKLFKLNEKYFHPAKLNKECIEYANKRKFPQHIFETLWFNNHPKQPFGNMLIYPFQKGEYFYGFQGRRLAEKRFFNYSKNEAFKIYNIFNVDLTKDVYIFESIIDSFHKKNSVAMCGSDLSLQVQKMIPKKTWVFDYDRTGIFKAIKYVERSIDIDSKDRFFIPPTELRGFKDINAMVCAGIDENYIERVISENSFSGFSAKSKLYMIKSMRKL